MKILVSAGEDSGDFYAAELVSAIRRRHPGIDFFGCTGPKMQAAGVRTIVDSRRLAVVGLVEVIRHIPGIWKEFRRLVRAADKERPKLAILTDSPDFHLRIATQLRKRGVPVIYLIAPQVWAWRQSRVKRIRRDVRHLLCIFPFEELWFRERGVAATYIGHPLPRLVRPRAGRAEFCLQHGLDTNRRTVVLLPGSRMGEVKRHLPYLLEAAAALKAEGHNVIAATPPGFLDKAGAGFFRERNGGLSIQVIEGQTWDALAHSDLALAASGTVTIEAALLGTPMVTFYRVTGLSWFLGRYLVRVPYYSMVNLVAGRKVVPELMQEQMTGRALAEEARRLLTDEAARDRMKEGLAEVVARLSTVEHPIECAARIISEFCEKELAHGT